MDQKAKRRENRYLARMARVARPASHTMWLEYMGLARQWARVSNGASRAAWALSGAAQCRAHIIAQRRQGAAP
jgi:hypothetical protein